MSESEDCCVQTSKADLNFGLPTSTSNAPGTPPNVLAQNRAIEARYGKETSGMSEMKTTSTNDRFAGPGSS